MLDDPNGSLAKTPSLEQSGAPVLDGANIRRRLPLLRLPVMPQVLSRLLNACLVDGAAGEELATQELAGQELAGLVALVALDPGIAAKVIGVASSSAVNTPATLSNLGRCVASAGPAAIKAIATSESAARVFGASSSAREFALNRIWFHALKCALLAKTLAADMRYPDVEEAYLAGLLHDVGSLALAAIDPVGYPQLLSQGQDDENLCRLELQRYQVTHAEVGAWLAQDWQVGAFVPDSILYHHAPIERLTIAHPLIRITVLANHLAQIDPSSGLAGAMEFARLCGAPPESVAPALERASAELKKIAGQLGVEWQVGGAAPDPAPDIPALLHGQSERPKNELQASLEKKVLLDSAQGLFDGIRDIDAALEAVAHAGLILFGLKTPVLFLREGATQMFVGKALLHRHAKAGQLKFLAGQSESAIAQAIQGVPVIWSDRNGWREPLDSQLARLLDAPGVVCIPAGTGSRCRGVVVAGFVSPDHAEWLHGRTDMLRAFGNLVLASLEGLVAEMPAVAADIPTEVGASREQVRQLLHEVSNPLAIVRNYLGTLKISVDQHAIGEKELRIVTEEIDRVTQILDHFRRSPPSSAAFTPSATAAGPGELQELAQGILALCSGSGLVPPAVRIETHYSAAPPVHVAHPDKLKQVLLNLMKNAFEAMPDGGRFRLSTSRWNSGGAGDQVEIMLEDSGPGLPEEVQRGIYQPVASTKGGEHFGIGLSIVGQLVREMNGSIYYHSGQDGCRFRIILPVVTQ
jgi:signal transduction histidine kinase/HD-like signal output (HDOD) protein